MPNIPSSVYVVLKGAAMGAANVIPGVSGGTVAFITGIYERLINAIKSFDLSVIKMVSKGKFGEAAQHVDLKFLLCIGLGTVLSILTLAKVLKWAFENHDRLVWAFFFGLIAASIPAVGKLVRKWGPSSFIFVAIGFAVAFSMAFLPRAGQNDNLFYLMICGVVAVCSFIIPGLSGSFVLLLMGNYEMIMIDSVNNLRSDPAEAIKILIPVGIGGVLGMIAFSRFLSWLFKTHHDAAVSLITGFITGSLAIIWPWKEAVIETFQRGDEVKEKIVGYTNWSFPNFASGETWLAFLMIAIGAALVLVMERSAEKGKLQDAAESGT